MIYELVIEDENIDEVFAISLVEEPAIESNFVFFDKEKVQFAALNDDKRFSINCVMELIEKLQNNKQLADHITTLRRKYDEISRKYVEISYVIN